MKKRSIAFLIPIIIILAAYISFIANRRIIIVSGESMQPTLTNGNIVLASIYIDPVPGKIYMIKDPEEGLYVIKRLCGIPGDTIEIKDGATYRNGNLFMESVPNNWDNLTFQLGPNDYLFLGDNRNASYDARYWHRFVHLDEIELEAYFVIYPFSKAGALEVDLVGE